MAPKIKKLFTVILGMVYLADPPSFMPLRCFCQELEFSSEAFGNHSYEWKCCPPRTICGPVQGLRIPVNGKCFHSKIATLCQIGWIWKESKTFRSFGCSRIQSSCNLCQISTEMYCFGQVASRTKLSSCWHSSCNEPRGKTQTIPSFQGKYPSHLMLVTP